jgi:2-aminoadipate transaminase
MKALFTEIMKNFDGYTIGKTLKYLRDPEIISFAGGLPSSDIFPMEFIQEVTDRFLKENGAKVLQYSQISGEKNLIDAVINYLEMDDIRIGPENIMITTSGQHGLDLVGRLFLEPQDVIVIDLPTFGGALAAFEMESPQYIARNIMDDGSDVTGFEADIKELLDQGKKLKFIYVVPDFQNPSGITTSLEKRLALLDLSKKYGIPLVEDSPYRELRYRGENIPSIYSLDKNEGNVIGLYTFSKILCPGLRVGFNIGPPEVIQKFTFIKEANILNTPKLNQDICTAFFQEYDLESHFAKACSYYREKLDFFLDTVEDNFPKEMGITWTKPEGGLFLWMTVPDKIDTMDLFMKAIDEKVAFVPGEIFYPRSHVNHNTMRINFSYPTKEQILEGVRRLSAVVRKYQ